MSTYEAEIGDSLLDLSRDVHRFLTGTIQATTEGQARKCAQEAVEFAEDPCREEARDVLITLLGWYALEGIPLEWALDDAARKMTANLARTWQQRPDGTWQHVGDAA